MTVTHRCAVLGSPISHSLSPVLHNAVYRALGLDGWSYGRREVDEAGLPAFLAGLDHTWAGLSLTMPLKRTVIPHGTPSDLWSRRLGVANTAVLDWTDGDRAALRLYNTDVIGIVLAFDHAAREHAAGPLPSHEATALIVGNGNTAASAVAACTMMPAIGRVVVAARRPGANPTLRDLASLLPAGGGLREIDLADAGAVLDAARGASVVISTVPAHAADPLAGTLAGTSESVRLPGTLLDVVYDPRPTRLMEAWRSRGGTAVGGEEMLLYQALVQVLLMTGEWDGNPPSDAERRLQDVTVDDDALEIAMRHALEEAL